MFLNIKTFQPGVKIQPKNIIKVFLNRNKNIRFPLVNLSRKSYKILTIDNREFIQKWVDRTHLNYGILLDPSSHSISTNMVHLLKTE